MSDSPQRQSLSQRPALAAVADAIARQSRFQKKAVQRLLESADEQHLEFAEDWVGRLATAAGGEDPYERLAKDYVDYTKMIRIEEMHFRKAGEYRYTDFDEVAARVYTHDHHMASYVTGLGMTQVFWPNHYAIVRFFLDAFVPRISSAERGAEAGVGHGLFHSEMLRGAARLTSTMLDLSPVSLGFTEALIAATGLDQTRAKRAQCDIQAHNPLESNSLDVLLLGEIIEHLSAGERVMREMADKVKDGGLCFFTTAANAPAEDHILLFRKTGEIRTFLGETGWTILEEHIGTLKGMSVEEAEEGGHSINYAAILTPKARGDSHE